MSGGAAIKEFLQERGIKVTENLLKALDDLGVNEISDLNVLKEDDFKNSGLKVVQIRRLLQACSYQDFHQPMISLPKDDSEPVIKIGYILLQELFIRTQEVSYITLNSEKDTMEFLIGQICDRAKISERWFKLELFSQKGSALDVNIFTMKLTLKQWKISNGDIFYAFIRLKEQPHHLWGFGELKDIDLIDSSKGQNSLKIISEAFGTFTIKFDPQGLQVNTLLRKAAHVIRVPSQYLSLYKSVTEHHALKDEDMIDVQNGDMLFLRLKTVRTFLRNYGKQVYKPFYEQTDKGLSKFYSILRYLHFNCDKNAITSAIMKLTDCPPVAIAFYHFFHLGISHISYLTALVEGFYFLSRAILECFSDTVPLEQTFEFSDYILGFILKMSKSTQYNDCNNFKSISLTCPITGLKIIQPVCVQSKWYEYIAAKEKIEKKEALPGCQAVNIGDLLPDEQLEHHLITTAFSPAHEIHVFESSKLLIPPLTVPCDWKELKDSAALLKVIPPDSEDLTNHENVLTYISGGQVVVFTDATKLTDFEACIYNPLSCKIERYNSHKMKSFKCSDEKMITHNIVDFLNPKLRSRLPNDALSLPSVVQPPKDPYEITKEPKEAIMVLLDTSGSMTEPIFNDQDTKYRKITAGCNFFTSFADRTEAYHFDHVIGVMHFNTEVTQTLQLCQSWTKFKSAIVRSNVLLTGGGTALYDALVKAAEKLCEFGLQYQLCQKRILCLTDGEDNKSRATALEAVNLLRSENIVVDTILITPKGNNTQKAICHATGGWCFLPTNLSEGTRLFEMEVLLSVGQRTEIKKPPINDLADLKQLEDGEYDSNNPYSFRNKHVKELDEVRTCTAKQMVLLASFVSSEQTSSFGQKPHIQRLYKELRNYEKNPHDHFSIFPSESNVCIWKILMKGDESTNYKGVYLLFAKFPDSYPYKPPEIRFVTKIYHCNINSVGRICHPILGRNYISTLSIREIFDQIFGLLLSPQPDDPLDSILAEEFHTNKDEYMRKARELDEKEACQITWDDYTLELTKESIDVVDMLKCPLSGKLFMDPVTTQYGHTYERHALLQYLRHNNNLDPKAGKIVNPNHLVSQGLIRDMADNLRKFNSH